MKEKEKELMRKATKKIGEILAKDFPEIEYTFILMIGGFLGKFSNIKSLQLENYCLAEGIKKNCMIADKVHDGSYETEEIILKREKMN